MQKIKHKETTSKSPLHSISSVYINGTKCRGRSMLQQNCNYKTISAKKINFHNNAQIVYSLDHPQWE